jgi:hypothetical protein
MIPFQVAETAADATDNPERHLVYDTPPPPVRKKKDVASSAPSAVSCG